MSGTTIGSAAGSTRYVAGVVARGSPSASIARGGSVVTRSSSARIVVNAEDVGKRFAGQRAGAGMFAPMGTAHAEEGGYRISGQFQFGSGSGHAQFMGGSALVFHDGELAPMGEDGTPPVVGFLIPAEQVEFRGNWDVMGLIGTGSNDVLIDDLFVPAHRMLTLEQALSGKPPGSAVNDNDLWKVPFFAAISLCLCGAAMGMAKGALETYIDQIAVRKTRGAALSQPQSMANFPTIQARVAEAAAAIDAAQNLVARDCNNIMSVMAEGRELTIEERARNKGNLSFAVKMARKSTDLLFESVGGAGLSNASITQRFWRDLHGASKHISLNWDMCSTLYGRVSLGLPSGTAQF